MTVISEVVCDGCGCSRDRFAWPGRAHESRTEAKCDGWVQRPRGQDFCADCVEKGKADE
jgi:hypothetical protein